jgi:hypothetical protein
MKDVDRLIKLICERVEELWPLRAEPNPDNLKANGHSIQQLHTETDLEIKYGLLYQRGKCISDKDFLARYIDPGITFLKSSAEIAGGSLMELELPRGVEFSGMVGPTRLVVMYAIQTDDFVYRFDILVRESPRGFV